MTQRTRSHWKEYGTAFCATLVTATAGTCVGWASPTIPYLMSEQSNIPTTPDQGSWIVSIMILCSALTPIPSAYFADKYGRKTTLLLGAVPFILGWVLIIMAKSVAVLYIARMMSGLGYGIVYTVSPMYTGEIATNEIRGALATLITLMNKLGILMQYCIGPFVSMKTLATINLSIPIMFVLTFAWLPESPYFYAQNGQMDKAEQSLRRLRDGDVRNELKEIEYNIQEDMRNKGTWGDLFIDPSNRKTLWIILGIFTIQQWCGSAAVVAYAQNFFSNTRSGLHAHEQSIILGCVQVITATTSFLLVDKLGRKPLLLVSSLGVALMNALIGAYFVLSNEIGPTVTDYISWLPLMAILVYIIAYAIGLSTVPYVITAEMFPANVKSLASCFAHIYTGVSMFAVQKLYQVVADSVGIQYVFIGFSVFSSIGLVFILIALPETKGKSFACIQAQLKRRKSVLDKADALRADEF